MFTTALGRHGMRSGLGAISWRGLLEGLESTKILRSGEGCGWNEWGVFLGDFRGGVLLNKAYGLEMTVVENWME